MSEQQDRELEQLLETTDLSHRSRVRQTLRRDLLMKLENRKVNKQTVFIGIGAFSAVVIAIAVIAFGAILLMGGGGTAGLDNPTPTPTVVLINPPFVGELTPTIVPGDVNATPFPPTVPPPSGPELEALQPIIDSILSGSITERRDFVQFTVTGCTTLEGLGGPPKCQPSQADGTPVEVFPVMGPEGTYATRETLDASLEFTVKNLYAVYRVTAPSEGEYAPAGEYALVFDREMNDVPLPITVLVAGGKIVRLVYHFGTSPADILNSLSPEQVLYPVAP